MPLGDELNPDIKPGDDFYRYVNETWCQAHPIPDDKPRVTAFSELADENTERLRKLLEAPAADSDTQTAKLLRTFYRDAMDVAAIEEAGLGGAIELLDAIDEISDPAGITAFIGRRHGSGFGLLWGVGVGPDDKDSRKNVLQIFQGGLGMPDRDYYLEDGERFDSVRASYRTFLTSLFGLLGSADPAAETEAVLAIEQHLAGASATAVQKRDVDAMYNLYARAALHKEFAGLDWTGYLEAAGVGSAAELIIAQPAFIRRALELIAQQPLDSWRSYLRFHALRPLLGRLPKAYDQLNFSFYGTVLSGAQRQEDRYKRVINLCESMLAEPTGRLYVSRHFDEGAKQSIQELVGNVQQALAERINGLDWMQPATKERALHKLGTFLPLLGYPDEWRDFAMLELPGLFVDDVMAIVRFEWDFETSQLQKSVNRKQWLMSPATVNAYYWPNTNGITFPAAILQPPFFDASGDVAANYGAIGVVIGHEITHGFDDKGSKFDAEGNLASWWSEDDRRDFDARTQALKRQYDAFEIDGKHVNGELTLGENVADLGGMLIAYDALQRHLKSTGDRTTIDGLTPEQRFFAAYARVWRGNYRPELVHSYLVTDPHAPGVFRVNGVVPNVDAFYDAFEVLVGDALFKPPADRVRIW